MQKIPFKSCHLIFSEKRRIRMQPYIPHDFLSILPFILIKSKKAFSHIRIQNIIKFFSTVRLAEKPNFFQFSVFCERNTSVIEKIIIVNFIQTSLVQQKPHMPLKLLTVQKRLFKPLHDLLFLLSKSVRIFRIDCRKRRIQKRIFLSVQFNRTFFKINSVQKRPVF